MDAWNERQLNLMQTGGNQPLYDFFQEYDLLEESIQYKYKTKAASFYRAKVIE